MTDLSIKISTNSAPFLPQIIDLSNKNTGTIGFLPIGAFEEHSRKNQILVAHTDKQILAGYLSFRYSKCETTIVHLCVDVNFRKQHIPKKLLYKLTEISNESRGIGLKCRRDYGMDGFWSSLGFIALGEVKGRGKDEAILTRWWKDFGHPDLFTSYTKNLLHGKTTVVIDANIFYGMYSSEKEDDEAKALLAEWIPDDIELCLTDEIYNEINRSDNPEFRSKNRSITEHFPKIPYDKEKYESIKSVIVQIMGYPVSDSDKSDQRQLAKAIAGDSFYFVTQDKRILKFSDALYGKFQIWVLRPCDMIIKIDQIINGNDYQPARLSGTQYKLSLVNLKEYEIITKAFFAANIGEKIKDFKEYITTQLSDPRKFQCYVLASPAGDQIAYFSYEVTANALGINSFRIKQSTPLSKTIIRHLLRRFNIEAVQRGVEVVILKDPFIDENLEYLLLQDGFLKVGKNWIKISFKGCLTIDELLIKLGDISTSNQTIKKLTDTLCNIISNITLNNSVSTIIQIEKMIWPAKVIGYNIPSYIIPIKPRWAKNLFDEEMAVHDLFGASELIFNAESAYYRSKRPKILTAPGRIIWYASHQAGQPGAGSVRAISFLEEIYIDLPKSLYTQFRRLGIYGWNDVLETAKDDLNKEIMAIKFSSTYMLKNMISWKDLSNILRQEGIYTTLQSPIQVPESILPDLLN